MISVISSSFGGYDTLKQPIAQSVHCDFVFVTDQEIDGGAWEVIVDEARGVHPRTAAKKPKMRPWDYTSSEYVIWVDASAEIISPTFVQEVITLLGDENIAQFKHPERDCIYDEAQISLSMPKYKPHSEAIKMQMEGYEYGDQHPLHWGLWATGIIAYNFNKFVMKRFSSDWLAEVRATSYQDQLCEAVILRSYNIRPVEFPANLWYNDWVKWHPHRDEL